jgi:hypothetical protein
MDDGRIVHNCTQLKMNNAGTLSESDVDLYMHAYVVLIDFGLDEVYTAGVLVILYLQCLSLCVSA